MDIPKIADTKPIADDLKKGKENLWCACGESKNQPFCDFSHVSTPFEPLSFKAEEDGEAYLCMCKQTKNPPYCDGTHANLKSESGQETPAESTSGSTIEEPTLAYIKALAKDGLNKTGPHGEMGAMGVPIPELPRWNDIQMLAAQMATKPLMEDVAVGSELIIGTNAKKAAKIGYSTFCF